MNNFTEYKYYTVLKDDQTIGIFKDKNNALLFLKEQEKIEKQDCKDAGFGGNEQKFYISDLTTDFEL